MFLKGRAEVSIMETGEAQIASDKNHSSAGTRPWATARITSYFLQKESLCFRRGCEAALVSAAARQETR